MRMNLSIWLNLMLIVTFSLLLSGCLGNGDNKMHVAQGTHLKFMNMGPYLVELNLTDNNEYSIGDVKIDRGNVKTGPPDRFTPSNYTQYSRDIMDKMGGEKKLSLKIDHYDAKIMTSNDNLLQLGLLKWPWDGSAQYESHYLKNYDWVTAKGALDNEIDAASWIDDHTMLSLKMFNLNQSDSLAILDSVMSRSL